MPLKRAIKSAAGIAAAATVPLVRLSAGAGCIFVYHRVAKLAFVDRQIDDWNVAPQVLDSHITTLKACADIVPLNDIVARCSADPPPDRPAIALTFDDGYANFHTQVLPLLERHGVPATVFVVSSMIGLTDPPPFDAWSMKNRARAEPEAWLPLTWDQIEQCVKSGLVTVGAHSHGHLKANACSAEQLTEEVERSRDVLSARLGKISAYSYPYGSSRLGFVPPVYVRAVEAAGYTLAVTTDIGRVDAHSNPYLLPRVEAHGCDGPAVIRAKLLGSLTPFYLTDRLRRAHRAA